MGAGLLVVVAIPVVVMAGQDQGEVPVRWPRPVAGGPGTSPETGKPLATPSSGPFVAVGRGDAGGQGGEAPYSPSSVVVSLRDPADTTPITNRGGTVVGEIAGTDFVQVRTDDPTTLVAQLRADPAVAAVSLDYGRRATAVPNDGLYQQYQHDYLNVIRMSAAWDLVADASSQVVAVIDTGVDTAHPDLAGRVVPGFNVMAPGTAPSDTTGHGTFVAGVVAANANNGIGVAGVTWNGRVMPLKVFGGPLAYDSDVATGIVWAVDHGARVLNLSLGGPADSPLLHAAVRYAISRNVAVVAASGNEGTSAAQYPAAFDEVIAVGATDATGKLVDFSSYGDWLDVTAPGFAVVSTSPGGGYAIGDGTSFAAPIVAGVTAMIRAQNPALTPAQLRERLAAAARDAGPRGWDPYYGAGVIDAARALGAASTADFPFPTLGSDEPNDAPQQAVQLDPWVFDGTPGSIGVEGDVDWYRFDAPTEQSITLTLRGTGFDANIGQNANLRLDVYAGRSHVVVDSAGPGEFEHWTGTVPAGPSYLRVTNANGSADPRVYSIVLGLAGPPSGPPVPGLVVDQRYLGPAAAAVAVADFTGDGRNDIVGVTTYGLGPHPHTFELFVMPQDSSGGIGQPVWYQPVQSMVESIALSDVDRDGVSDVVICGAQGLEWFRQAPIGTLSGQGVLIDLGYCRHVAAADMNNDGIADLVTSFYNNGTQAAVLTHGVGSSYTTEPIPDASAQTLDTAVGDVDGDGRPDVLRATVNTLRVHHNRADGWTTTDYLGIAPSNSAGTVAATELDSVAIGDVTGDGRPDMIATNSSDRPAGVVNVFQQNADGSLATPVMYSAGDKPQSVEVTDIDGDGRNDLAMINNGSGGLTFLYQQSDGTFGERLGIKTPASQHPNGQGLAFGDLDGSGRPEIVSVNDSGLSILRWVSPNLRGAVVQSVSPMPYAADVALGTAPRVVFAEPVDQSTVDNTSVRLVDGRTGLDVPGSVSYDTESQTATFMPDASLHRAKPYRIVVSGVHAADGLPVEPATSTFVTTMTGPLSPLQNFKVRGQFGTAASVSTVVPIGDVEDLTVRVAQGTTPPASPTTGMAGYIGVGGGIMIGDLTPGQTYSFSVWYRDRAGTLSPPSTATLVGTTLTMTGTTTAPGAATADVTFNGTVTTQTGAAAGITVPLVATCAEASFAYTTVATATANDTGSLSAVLRLGAPRCAYRWALTDSASYMGGASAAIRVTAGPNPPSGPTPPRER